MINNFLNIIGFFLACIITGLEYIHSNNVIHRDIKPENLVLDENGYVRITDFGIAKYFSNNNSKETSGTPGYMAPEVMKGQNHSFTVDYFAIGIMGYEFMLGKRPYLGRSRREIKEQMMIKNAQITLSEIPNGWSEEAADFFNKLLQRKPENRLGYKGIWELKQHRWMKFFPWDKLLNKELESPFIPEKKDNFDKKYCEANDTIDIETKVRYEKYRNDAEYENCFSNFTYYGLITESEDENILMNSYMSKKNHNINNNSVKNTESKENEQDMSNLIFSYEETNKSNKINYKNENVKEIRKQINNSMNKKSYKNFQNISTKKPNQNYSFTMKYNENFKVENNNKIKKEKMQNLNYLKNEVNKKQSILLRNPNTIEDYSGSTSHRNNYNKNNNNNNNNRRNSRSKTPVYMEKRQLILDSIQKNNRDYNRSTNKSMKNNLDSNKINQRLMINQNQNQYNNYHQNVRHLFSKKPNQKTNICSPGYYSKHSLQINCNSNKFHNLLLKRNTKSDYSKSPKGSFSSIDITKNTKSPKITTSTNTSMQRYQKKNKSISPFPKQSKYLRPINSAKNIHKNYINERSKNSRINLSNLYNQNFSYAKRIKEMNSFNYNNRMMGSNINNKNNNNKKTSEIISSYSISSSNILKQIRNANYNKNKVNNTNKNNPLYLYNNINNNKRLKQNNKISLELELNADSQTFSKGNKVNNSKQGNKSKNRKSNSKVSIKNNILNKNHSTINIGSMKMAMNGNININVVIKGNNNTTNLINKIEVKKKNYENILKNRSLNNKKFQRSHSIGFFNLKL